MKKRLRIAVVMAVLLGMVLSVLGYFQFVTKTVYEESVSHLTEIFHQSDNMLRELANRNMTYLHMWSEYLKHASREEEVRNYIEKAKKDAGCLYFYFLSADGDYKMLTGETGYLGLQESMEEKIRRGEDVIANAAVPATRLAIFRLYSRLSFSCGGTLPRAIRWASPSAMAVFPTPGSPMRAGLFLFFRHRIPTTISISRSLPITGSMDTAFWTRSSLNCSNNFKGITSFFRPGLWGASINSKVWVKSASGSTP